MKRWGTAVMVAVLQAAVPGAVTATKDTNHAAGMKLYSEGHLEEASLRLEKAYRSHPHNCRIAFDYALAAPCSVAVDLFERCSSDTSCPDSLRAASFAQLGDYSYVHSAFKTAAERYRLASKLRSDPLYRHRWALAAMALHDRQTARSLWHTITLDHGTEQAYEAHYHLGLLDMEDGHHDSAFQRFSKSGPFDTTRSWTIAATAAKLECALRLGKQDSAKVLERLLLPVKERLLERDLLKLAALSSEKQPPGPPSSGKDPNPRGIAFTLQVGAFGSLDNASGLQARLVSRFEDVTILPVTLSDQLFYRVRVGTFSSREVAEAFGAEKLAKEGIPFKAVEK